MNFHNSDNKKQTLRKLQAINKKYKKYLLKLRKEKCILEYQYKLYKNKYSQ